MTSQTLIPQVSQSAPQPASSSRLPLHGNCATELQHLQADAEALLQQLQALKEQRLSTMKSDL
ncbi:hypothetical protein H6F67_20230 [Microcoleus sp. FACHB-1515]|uniref:hypothetical protein n=1 Tax=Cyanophyceae TaxID=3028117 RepID=UPI001684659F|nr:hypothetical protein [Microcoleus sp. FACHB-1515]MBD2092181.1 hypothetical protein [Microcoleus sp. FACHB-1515]